MSTALAPALSVSPAIQAVDPDFASRSFTSATAARNHVKDLVRSTGWDPLAIAVDALFGELLLHGPGNTLVVEPGLDLPSVVARFRWTERR